MDSEDKVGLECATSCMGKNTCSSPDFQTLGKALRCFHKREYLRQQQLHYDMPPAEQPDEIPLRSLPTSVKKTPYDNFW